MDKLLVSVTEAAAMLSISRSQAYDLVARGLIPSVRLTESSVLRVPVEGLRKRVRELAGMDSQAS